MGVEVDTGDLERLFTEAEEEIAVVIDTYMIKIQRGAREIVRENGKVDTGRLIASIHTKTSRENGIIEGEVNSATNYAVYVHEGAKRHFVPFRAAPSLRAWARRHGIAVKENGGLIVKMPATKFLEKPADELKDEFTRDLERVLR